jgi:hypothetical protein
MQLSRGVSSAQNLPLSHLIFTFDLQQKQYRVLAKFDTELSFSLSELVTAKDCNAWVLIDVSKDGTALLDSMHYLCAVGGFPQYLHLHIIKTPDNEAFLLQLDREEYSLEKLNSEVLALLNPDSAHPVSYLRTT